MHPKDVLYDLVYEPLTVAWFDELAQSPERHMILARAPRHNLLHNLDELTALIHKLVDLCFEGLGGKWDDMLAVVRRHQEHVLWEQQQRPSYFGTDREFKNALSYKFKRNISIGAVEIVICLEAATTYGRFRLGLRGERLAQVLRRSGQLGGSLALLHNEQEQLRLQQLTGENDYLKYPEVTFADVIEDKRYRIAQDKLVAVGSGDDLRLRFVATRLHPGPFDCPTRRCPAYLRAASHPSRVLNDDLWRLIVDIYQLSGRFE